MKDDDEHERVDEEVDEDHDVEHKRALVTRIAMYAMQVIVVEWNEWWW